MKEKFTQTMESEHLYHLCSSGSKKGWEEAGRYVRSVISWKEWGLSRPEKEDLVQETLLYFISGGLEKVKEPKAFKSLLRLKTFGNIIDARRKSRGMTPVPIGPLGNEDEEGIPGIEVSDPTPDSATMIFSKQARAIFLEIMATISDDKCKPLLDKYFKYKLIGEKIGRIAKELKKPVGTVAAMIHRCLKPVYRHPKIIQLKALLQERG
ncbi:MAG: sigma-70 family RNA polymerase sigma factor [Pseudomonadota bacterium]